MVRRKVTERGREEGGQGEKDHERWESGKGEKVQVFTTPTFRKSESESVGR